MGMYILTGAAGFIASRVAALLLAEGHRVYGVDNMSDAYDVRLKEWRLGNLRREPNFTFVQRDISDRAAVDAFFGELGDAKIDAVINLAARAGVRQSVENPWVYYDANTTGTLNLLEHCRTRGIPKFVLASTSSLYGAENEMPFSETADTNRPLSPYAASKKAAETLAYTYHYLYGTDVTVLRFFTVYGPAGRPDMSLFRFVQFVSEGKPVPIYGDGQQSRDFTYVDDIARGVVAALRPVKYEIINLGSDAPVVLRDALSAVEEFVGRTAVVHHLPMHKSDVRATWANISKAEQLLGWRPQVDLREGVRRLVEWYVENRSWASTIETGV
ncbi:MAG TPA: NAD-dependent epimerase/dehydratase family protein [Thermoanaerobaculia bacterium]|nr:NAD-dependent epimerase/dehydratase family protein [Thermoanaerobaculia bacterium]